MQRAKLTVSQLFQNPLRQALMALGKCQEKSEQNCRYRLDYTQPGGWARAKQFTNGTFYVEATHPGLFEKIMATVAQITGQSLPPAPSPPPSLAAVSQAVRGQVDIPHAYIGTDESGKGDYFGPLVIAGLYFDPVHTTALKKLGVQDSKNLTDARILPMAKEIEALVSESACAVIAYEPAQYNALYESLKLKGQNLNHLLAGGHARVIETLLTQNPDCAYAIADQFGSEHYIRSQLQTRGKAITLYQTPKAEANIGVAAASIIARAAFVQSLRQLGQPYGVSLLPGAGNNVLVQARSLVNAHGPIILDATAKKHFKTTQSILV